MVKGVCKQVIVLHAPETKMFEQAIFILRDDSPTVSESDLLKEAQRIVKIASPDKHNRKLSGLIWACGGAFVTGAMWFLSLVL